MSAIKQLELSSVNNFSLFQANNFGCKLGVMDTLGKRIKFARNHALNGKMTQRRLGEVVGLSQQLIGKLENGAVKETAALVRIAIATGYRAEWLETGEGPKTDAEAGLEPPLTPKQKAFLLLLDGLAPSQQSEFIQSLESQKRKNDELFEALAVQGKAG